MEMVSSILALLLIIQLKLKCATNGFKYQEIVIEIQNLARFNKILKAFHRCVGNLGLKFAWNGSRRGGGDQWKFPFDPSYEPAVQS